MTHMSCINMCVINSTAWLELNRTHNKIALEYSVRWRQPKSGMLTSLEKYKWQFAAEKRKQKSRIKMLREHQTSGQTHFTQYCACWLLIHCSRFYSRCNNGRRARESERASERECFRFWVWNWRYCGRCFARSMVNNNRINFEERTQAAHF